MGGRDIPPEALAAIHRWAKRKSLDVKWLTNSLFTPEMEVIYLSILENALRMGALEGYMQCMKDYKIDEDKNEY